MRKVGEMVTNSAWPPSRRAVGPKVMKDDGMELQERKRSLAESRHMNCEQGSQAKTGFVANGRASKREGAAAGGTALVLSTTRFKILRAMHR